MAIHKLTIEYDGLLFFGAQKQGSITAPQSGRSRRRRGGRSNNFIWNRVGSGIPATAQDALEWAAEMVFGKKTDVIISSRTDAGVHAIAQVCHLAHEGSFPQGKLSMALNYYLAKIGGIRVTSDKPQPDDFHARFSCKGRAYRYIVLNRCQPSPILSGRAWHVYEPLNLHSMKRAASLLVGRHDFTAFRGKGCQAPSPEKTITQITISAEGFGLYPQAQLPNDASSHAMEESGTIISLECHADSFLYRMVRRIAGAIVDVGAGKYSVSEFEEFFRSKAATDCRFQCAPAHGLYFLAAKY